jgi:hypothetical protein
LGRHQRELSLFAIPSSITDTNDNDKGSNGDSPGSSVEATTTEHELTIGMDESHDTQDDSPGINSSFDPETGFEKQHQEEIVEDDTQTRTLSGKDVGVKFDDNKDPQSVYEETLERTPSNAPKSLVTFKDAIGRKYRFPWDLCKTWKVCHPVSC